MSQTKPLIRFPGMARPLDGFLLSRGFWGKEAVGRVLRKEDAPMAKFLMNVLAAVVAGVLVALILRYL